MHEPAAAPVHTGAGLRYQDGMNTSRLRIGLFGAACMLLAAPSYAQTSLTPGTRVTDTPRLPTRQAPPPALPGSRTEPTAVAPASRPALDMPPTEALFDAINRGDLAATKDALNRGADTNGHNVLGLSPLDLAIDLGRNEITFILLSMRGSETRPMASPPVTADAGRQTARRRASQREAAQDSVLVRPARFSSAPRRPSAAQAPRRFAGDGGTPNPSAGFLGFDASR